MRTTTLLSTLALGAGLVAGGVLLAPSFAQDTRPATAAEHQWLSIPQVHEKLAAAGYRNVEKIERERGGYEVRATSSNGERVKLRLDPQTGAIADQRRERRRRDDSHGRRVGDGELTSADCNERRCRDDLPQQRIATPSGAK